MGLERAVDAGRAAVADVAAAELAKARAVLLIDHAAASVRASLVVAAQLARPKSIAFMVRHTSGFLCAPMTETDCDRLDLPLMVDASASENPSGIAYAVSVDVRSGTTTGISARDRALTFNALADSATTADDLTRPGHVVPLRGRDGGVLDRAGRTEAAIDLCRLAALRPVAVTAELVSDAGSLPTQADLERFCEEYGIVAVSIADVVARRRRERAVTLTGTQSTSTPRGTFEVHNYRCEMDGGQHLALRCGDLSDGEDVLVGVHAECVAGDVFGSHSCGCGESLAQTLEAIAAEGRGLLVYLRARPGLAVPHQQVGLGREVALSAEILAAEGVRSVRLLTDSATTATGLERQGVRVVATGPVTGSAISGRRWSTWRSDGPRAANSSA